MFTGIVHQISVSNCDTEMLKRPTQPSQTHQHTDTHTQTRTEDNDIQTTTDWHPDTLAVRTSNRLIEAIKPQRQRVLLKPLLPAATDLHPHFFFLHPPIHQFISPSIHCFLLQPSIPPPQHVYPPHPPLLLWVWCLASGPAQRLVSTPCQPHPVGTAPVKDASQLWHFNYISSTHSTGWTQDRRERL